MRGESELTRAGKLILDAIRETTADLERAAADTESAPFHEVMERQGMRVHVPKVVDVKATRRATGLSRARFAERFGFDLASIRNWEQGRRRPVGPARAAHGHQTQSTGGAGRAGGVDEMRMASLEFEVQIWYGGEPNV